MEVKSSPWAEGESLICPGGDTCKIHDPNELPYGDIGNIKNIQKAVDHHEYYRNCYLWSGSDQGNGQARTRKEKELNFTIKEEIGGHHYQYISRVSIPRKRFHYRGEFTRDGIRGDVRLFKKLLRQTLGNVLSKHESIGGE